MLGKIIKVSMIIIVVFILISFILPREVVVSRSLLINASAEHIFPLVNSPKQMHTWSPWSKRDPKIVNKFTGPDSGVGASNKWTSDHPKVGSGSQTIIKSETNRLSVMSLNFGDKGQAEASFELKPVGDSTNVTWSMTTDTGYNPIFRWIGNLFFDGWIGKDYEEGLQSIKKVVESS